MAHQHPPAAPVWLGAGSDFVPVGPARPVNQYIILLKAVLNLVHKYSPEDLHTVSFCLPRFPFLSFSIPNPLRLPDLYLFSCQSKSFFLLCSFLLLQIRIKLPCTSIFSGRMLSCLQWMGVIGKHTQSCVTGVFDSTVSPAGMVVSSVTTMHFHYIFSHQTSSVIRQTFSSFIKVWCENIVNEEFKDL